MPRFVDEKLRQVQRLPGPEERDTRLLIAMGNAVGQGTDERRGVCVGHPRVHSRGLQKRRGTVG